MSERALCVVAQRLRLFQSNGELAEPVDRCLFNLLRHPRRILRVHLGENLVHRRKFGIAQFALGREGDNEFVAAEFQRRGFGDFGENPRSCIEVADLARGGDEALHWAYRGEEKIFHMRTAFTCQRSSALLINSSMAFRWPVWTSTGDGRLGINSCLWSRGSICSGNRTRPYSTIPCIPTMRAMSEWRSGWRRCWRRPCLARAIRSRGTPARAPTPFPAGRRERRC